MVFSGVLFLYYFLPIVLGLYYISPRKLKNAVLFIVSLFFYAWGEPYYIFLMLFSITFNYVVAIFMDKYKDKKTIKKAFLVLSLVVNIALLGFYKYSGFFTEIVNSIFRLNLEVRNITLPIGISFYTFQIMSYVIDVYRSTASVQKNFISIGTYITLFPQLIAGPIVRYASIDEQLTHRRETKEKFISGVGTFAIGLSKKVFLANNIGLLWDNIKNTPFTEMSVLNAWLGIIAFALQIYYDFSGYSDMAIGLGRMLGFEFDINFNYPYISKSITEFWRRWHISLGTWFREYVYIPLGGSRQGKVRTSLNLLIVWMLTGLWHGASINFVLWGLYYGIILILEKLFLLKVLRRIPKVFCHIYSIALILIGWVFFECSDMGYLKIMFGSGAFLNSDFLYNLRSYFVIIGIGIVGSMPGVKNLYYKITKGKTAFSLILTALALVVCTAYLLDSTYNPFLYFRF